MLKKTFGLNFLTITALMFQSWKRITRKLKRKTALCYWNKDFLVLLEKSCTNNKSPIPVAMYYGQIRPHLNHCNIAWLRFGDNRFFGIYYFSVHGFFSQIHSFLSYQTFVGVHPLVPVLFFLCNLDTKKLFSGIRFHKQHNLSSLFTVKYFYLL